MGFIARVLSFLRVTRNDAEISDVKIDTGGGANKTVEHFSSPGDDSYPLKTDYVVTTGIQKSGGQAAVGYIDPINEPVAEEGEKRIYSRDSLGAIKAAILLKNDGSIEVTGNVTLLINTLSAFGVTDTVTNVTLHTHVHASVGAPPTPGS